MNHISAKIISFYTNSMRSLVRWATHQQNGTLDSSRTQHCIALCPLLRRFVYLTGPACCLLFLTTAVEKNAVAALVIYTGDVGVLQTNPVWLSISHPTMLFPGTTLFPLASGNSVSVNIGAGGTSPSFIFGGLSQEGSSQNNTVAVNASSTTNSAITGGHVQAGVGEASGNTVTLQSGSTVRNGIYGGQSFAGMATGNHVIVESGATAGQIIWGGASDTGDVTNNTVTVTRASVVYSIFGGLTYNAGTISGNKVILTDSNITQGALDLYGGLANKDGDVRQNSVVISGNSTINASDGGYRSVLGGQSATGWVDGNTVLLSGQVTAKHIIGGNVGKESGATVTVSGSAQKNSVTLKAEQGYSPVVSSVIGAQVTEGPGDAVENVAIVEGGTISGNVIGGSVSGTGNAYKNQASISGTATAASLYAGYSAINGGYVSQNHASLGESASLTGSLYGGYSVSGYAQANQVLMTGGAVNGWVYGGRSGSNYAHGNTVTVTGGKVTGIIGGYAIDATNGKASSNHVNVKNAETTGSIYGSWSALATSHNTVTVDGTALIGSGPAGGTVYGGYSTAGAASENVVIIKDGTIKGNASTSLYGGFANGGEASENQVYIEGGTLDKTIYAGYGKDDVTGNSITVTGGKMATLVGGLSVNGDATGNRISLSGGEVTGNIFAGYTASGNATSNTITLSGNPNLIMATLVGGNNIAGSGDIFTGNTLIINAPTAPLRVNGIQNFQNYQFVLPDGLTTGSVLVQSTNAVNLTGSTVQSLGIASGGFLLSQGHYVTLIDNVSTPPENNGASLIANVGVMTYNFNLALNGNALDITLGSVIDTTPPPSVIPTPPTNTPPPLHPSRPVEPTPPVRVNPKTKAFTEAQVAGLSILTHAADLAAGTGTQSLLENIHDAENCTTLTRCQNIGFGVVSGTSTRTDTGSHIKVNGFSLLVGAGRRQDTRAGELTLGGFFETGQGTINTYNSFNALPEVKGSGDTRYTGVGVLAHHASTENFYTEGSARIGRINTDFNSPDFTDDLGRRAQYDMSATYTGLHAGMGKLIDLNNKSQFDVYSQYFWTHQGSEHVEVFADNIDFESMNSHRLRVGGRYNHSVTKAATLYVGTALEREFEGKARASVYGYAIEAPELKGNSGIQELGVNFRPTIRQPLTLNLGVQGYVGQREGVTGNLHLKYAF